MPFSAQSKDSFVRTEQDNSDITVRSKSHPDLSRALNSELDVPVIPLQVILVSPYKDHQDKYLHYVQSSVDWTNTLLAGHCQLEIATIVKPLKKMNSLGNAKVFGQDAAIDADQLQAVTETRTDSISYMTPQDDTASRERRRAMKKWTTCDMVNVFVGTFEYPEVNTDYGYAYVPVSDKGSACVFLNYFRTKPCILIHEIGHLAGLGHTNDESRILHQNTERQYPQNEFTAAEVRKLVSYAEQFD